MTQNSISTAGNIVVGIAREMTGFRISHTWHTEEAEVGLIESVDFVAATEDIYIWFLSDCRSSTLRWE